MAEALRVHDEKIPLRQDESGLVYVGTTRVTLDCLVEMFDHGASPEEIAEEYDSVALADVYAVLTYYLRHKEDVQNYLAHREKESREAQVENKAGAPGSLGEKLSRARRRQGSHGDPASS